MPVRMEVYRRQDPSTFSVDVSPVTAQRVENERSSTILIPIAEGFESMSTIEAFGIFSQDIVGGVKIMAWTLDISAVPRILLNSEGYKAELFQKLMTEPQTITTKTEEHDVPEGEAWQYPSAFNDHKVVFWHETGSSHDLSAYNSISF